MSGEEGKQQEEEEVEMFPANFAEVNTLSNRFMNFVNLSGASRSKQGVEFNPGAIESEAAPTFEKEPYYVNLDESDGYRNNHNLSLAMSMSERPTLNALVECCRKERSDPNVVFEQGMFVEYLASNMEWKIGVVNRVVKLAPDSWDFKKQGPLQDGDYEVFYNIGFAGLLDDRKVRAPTKGLQFLFGSGPWIWQQFVLLKIEKRLRFDEDHEYDFAEIDCVKFASDHWRLWLEAEENKTFREIYDDMPIISQKLLKYNLLSPFVLMDDIVEDKETWNFFDKKLSIYTYAGVFGSGFLTLFTTLVIQIVAPLVIAYNVFFRAGDEVNPRFDTTGNEDFLPEFEFKSWCLDEQNEREEGKLLIVIVVLVYLSTVLPSAFYDFYATVGGFPSTFSRVCSLRQKIWSQNDDSAWQQFGFKLDRLMNTGYIAFLYSVMLFVLVQTPVILDLILNALAIDFIHEIDQKICQSPWYDGDKRYIKAGTIELVLQSSLRLEILEKPRYFCKFFNVDYKGKYVPALGRKASLKDATLAARDDSDPQFMSKKERIFDMVAEKAAQHHSKFVKYEYSERTVQFGYFDQLLQALNLKQKGIFNRYPEYRTWSRWEKLIFMGSLPDDLETSTKMLEKKMAVKVQLGTTEVLDFVVHVLTVITGVDILSSTAQAIWHKHFWQVPLKIMLGILEWFAYIMQLLFPVVVFLALFFLPYCY